MCVTASLHCGSVSWGNSQRQAGWKNKGEKCEKIAFKVTVIQRLLTMNWLIIYRLFLAEQQSGKVTHHCACLQHQIILQLSKLFRDWLNWLNPLIKSSNSPLIFYLMWLLYVFMVGGHCRNRKLLNWIRIKLKSTYTSVGICAVMFRTNNGDLQVSISNNNK